MFKPKVFTHPPPSPPLVIAQFLFSGHECWQCGYAVRREIKLNNIGEREREREREREERISLALGQASSRRVCWASVARRSKRPCTTPRRKRDNENISPFSLASLGDFFSSRFPPHSRGQTGQRTFTKDYNSWRDINEKKTSPGNEEGKHPTEKELWRGNVG